MGGKALRQRAVEVARDRMFRTVIVEPGHGATRHIWLKYCGGAIKAEVPFDTYRSRSCSRPCEGVEGSLAICEIVVRESVFDGALFWPFFRLKLICQAALADWAA